MASCPLSAAYSAISLLLHLLGGEVGGHAGILLSENVRARFGFVVPLFFAGRGRLAKCAEQAFQFSLKGCEGDGNVIGCGQFGRFVGFGSAGFVWRRRQFRRISRGSGCFLSKTRNRSVGSIA